jgi:hypothetical protein
MGQEPASRPSATTSLKDKTDAELLRFVLGRREEEKGFVSEDNIGDRAQLSPLDRLWEMDPKEAALAIVADHVDLDQKGVIFEIDNPTAKPPASGEIGIRWISGNEYAPPAEGVTILKYDGYRSKLLLSEVQIEGRPSKDEIEKAVMHTDEHPLYRKVAQQTYEIVWWLRHVRFKEEPSSYTSGEISSVDDIGRFWMTPDGPTVEQAIFGKPCGGCINRNEDPEAYASFADALLRRLMQRSGIKRRYPIPKVGVWKAPDADSEFLEKNLPPDQPESKAADQYVKRLCNILRNPQRGDLYDAVMDMLVPISEPLRYKNKEIDAALLDLVHRAVEAQAKPTPSDEDSEVLNPDDPDYETKKKARREKQDKSRAEQRLRIELESEGNWRPTNWGNTMLLLRSASF